MIVSAIAMFGFPKQLRGNRIPSPHQVSTIETEKTMARSVEEKEVKPNIRGECRMEMFWKKAFNNWIYFQISQKP